ncbi:MAG: tRNA lysidine(34) synthetase TilS [Clostridia bacterium]|nr:tRNA lysidine(34) synthetase TilS [Clostridia bacterium]
MAKSIQINLNNFFKGTPFEGKKLRIGVAVSGGRDSMALLDLLLKAGEDVTAINIEHGIRGESSILDSTFVRQYCEKLSVPVLFKAVDVLSFAAENGYTKEQAARILRYEYFDEILKENKVDVIALAHHGDDQAETILMRVLRGTGVHGLIGMKEISGRYIRPLLSYSREDIDAYVKANRIEFVEDESNIDVTFTRNYLRDELKTLKERYPSLVDSFARLSRNAEEVDEYLESQMGEIYQEGTETKVKLSDCEVKPLAKRLFIKAAASLGVLQDIEERHLNLIFDLIGKENGKYIELTHNLLVHKEENYLVFSLNETSEFKEVPFGEGLYKGYFVDLIETDDPRKEIEDRSALYMDADKIPEGTVIRKRKNGDYIHKFGGGSKKLGDYLTDLKVPKRKRDDLLVAADGSNILLVFGVDISADVCIEKSTKKIYKIF